MDPALTDSAGVVAGGWDGVRLKQGATLAWSITATAVVLNAVSLAMLIGVNGGVAPVPPLFSGPSGDITSVLAVFGAATVALISVVGGVLAARRPENPIGWLLAACGISAAGYYFTSQYATAALLTRPDTLTVGVPAAWLAGWLWLVAFGLIVHVLMVFPDGRPPTPHWRPVGWLVTGVLLLLALLLALAPGPLEPFPVSNPFGISLLGGVAVRMVDVAVLVWLTLPAVALASLLVRYRNARGIERLQLKYLVVASVLMLAAVAVHQAEVLPRALAFAALFVAAVSLPMGVSLAVLRYRLYDIDQVVSRSVSYGLLTILLVGVYVGAVFTLQQLLRPVTGESQLAVAGATLAVAALFGPLRGRIQVAVDRRFNRARYDTQRTVEGFRARLRDEVDLDEIGLELVGAVHATVQPARVSLWFRPQDAVTKS